jgi:outer membrane protein assembly factor BamB
MGALCAALALLASACTIDWAEWGRGVERQGWSSAELTVSPSNVAQLQHKWSVDLGAFINASPVHAGLIDVNGTPTDLLYVGTEHGDFFAINTAGQVVWSRNLGSQVIDCPDTPDKVYGVSAAALFDRRRNSVYVAGGDGYVYSLDPATGATRWRTQLTSLPASEVVFSAPTLFGNHLYFEIASHCDIAPYHGRVVDINVTTHAIAHAWYSTGATGPNGGGIWGWGGASVDPANGDVYVATGNAFGTPENAFWADSVVRLSANLELKAFHKPGVEIIDDDFGSTPVLFQKPGCPPQLVVEQKNGSLYLYDRASIATGFRQKISVLDPPEPGPGPHELGLVGVPLYYPKTQMVYVVSRRDRTGGPYKQGLNAFTFNSDCLLVPAWQTPLFVGIAATATIANDVVYVTGGNGGKVHALNAITGQPLWNSGTSAPNPIFAAPIIVKGRLYAGGYDEHLHAWGL